MGGGVGFPTLPALGSVIGVSPFVVGGLVSDAVSDEPAFVAVVAALLLPGMRTDVARTRSLREATSECVEPLDDRGVHGLAGCRAPARSRTAPLARRDCPGTLWVTRLRPNVPTAGTYQISLSPKDTHRSVGERTHACPCRPR